MYFKELSSLHCLLLILSWSSFKIPNLANGADLAKFNSTDGKTRTDCYCDLYNWECDCCPKHPMCTGEAKFSSFLQKIKPVTMEYTENDKTYNLNWLSWIVNYAYIKAFDDAFKSTLNYLKDNVKLEQPEVIQARRNMRRGMVEPQMSSTNKVKEALVMLTSEKRLVEEMVRFIFKKKRSTDKLKIFKSINSFINRNILENVSSKFKFNSILGIRLTEQDAYKLSSCQSLIELLFMNLVGKYSELKEKNRQKIPLAPHIASSTLESCTCSSFTGNCDCCPTHPVCPGGIPLPRPLKAQDNLQNLILMERVYSDAYLYSLNDLYERTIDIMKKAEESQNSQMYLFDLDFLGTRWKRNAKTNVTANLNKTKKSDYSEQDSLNDREPDLTVKNACVHTLRIIVNDKVDEEIRRLS